MRHGLSRTKEYESWQCAKKRCFNPKDRFYHRYGGRGITMCQRWKDSFLNFLEDIGKAPSPKHCLDRIDNDGNYEPSNCRWTTQKEQANNRTGIRLHKITFNGVTRNITEWNIFLGFGHGVVNRRIGVYGWSIEDALTRPKYYQHHKRKPS